MTVIVAPLLLGGRPPWAAGAIAGMAVVAVALSTWRHGLIRPAPALVATIAALAWTLLQAVPLPASLMEWAAPQAVANARAASALVGERPGLVAMTLSPGGTRLAILHATAIAGTMLVAWQAVENRNRDRVLELIAASTVLMAGIALAHGAFAADALFGLYTPQHARPPLLSPLLNPNHLGAFTAMGAPVALGLSLDAEARQRVLWAAAVVPLVLATLLSLSRGAVVSLVVGGFAFLVLLGLRRVSSRRHVLISGVGAFAIAGAIGLYAALGPLVREFEIGGLDKLSLVRDALDVVARNPWTGVGRGAFSASFVQLHGTSLRPEYPENLVVQWAAEWGVPAALALGSVLVVSLLRGASQARRAPQLGAAAAIIALVAHDCVDFALELPGVAVVAAALFACAAARGSDSAPQPTRVPAIATGTIAGLAVALVAAIAVQANAANVDALVARAQRASDRTEIDDVLADAAALHPAEPAIPLVAAARATSWDDARVPRLLNRAMSLAPGWESPHVTAAVWLARRGHWTQAWLELREAERSSAGRTRTAACSIALGRPDADVIFRAVGLGRVEGRALVEQVAACPGLPVSCAEALDLALQDTGSPTARARRARRALRERRPQDAIDLLDRNHASAESAIVLADALLATGRFADALATLAGVQASEDADESVVLTRRARALAGLERDAEMRAALARIRDLAGSTVQRRAAAWRLTAELEERRGNLGFALLALDEAFQLVDDDATRRRLAELTARAGPPARALQAHRERCRSAGTRTDECGDPDQLLRILTEPHQTTEQRTP